MKQKHSDKELNFFKNLETNFEQSEEELWAKIEQKTTQKNASKNTQVPRKRVVRLQRIQYAVAAAVLLIFGVGSVLRFYTETIISPKGEHLSHTLPDGSVIELNAESSLIYHPFWWTFEREIQFTGEAFFEVKKGSQFAVVSEVGTTQVLGTSFTIYARKKAYKVFCKTGKVKVSNPNKKSTFIIQPNEAVVFDNQNSKGKKLEAQSQEFMAWKAQKFNFVETPLSEVWAEIERQYNIKILASKKGNLQTFSGYFDKPQTAEQALELVGINFGLSYKKIANRIYQIQ